MWKKGIWMKISKIWKTEVSVRTACELKDKLAKTMQRA